MPLRLVIVLIAVLVTARVEAQMLDFVSFDGVHYLRWAEEPGRALTREDLGIEFATVECSYGEDRAGCAFGRDAAAAYMPAGTRMFALRGYRTDFRLAAVVGERIFLYQAWRNPRAKVGGTLWDIAGKVRVIDVQRGDPASSSPGRPVSLDGKDTADLVDMIVRGPVRPPRAREYGEPRYWLTVWLTDGTALVRPYFPASSELMDGVVVPAEFGRVLERYLRD